MSHATEALDRSVRVVQDYADADAEHIVAAMLDTTVGLRADAETLATPAGRTATFASFDAIARLGARVVLDVPDLALELPPGYRGDTLSAALLDRSTRLITPATRGPEACDLTICLGRDVPPNAISIGGSDTAMRLRLGTHAGGWSGTLPLGAGMAGSAAGAEVARTIVSRVLNGREGLQRFWPVTRPFDLGLPPIDVPTLDLGRIDFVSAGAITHAILFLLFQTPGVKLDGRLFDDDLAAADNLNRYFLLSTDDLRRRKVFALANLARGDIRLTGEKQRITRDTTLPLASSVVVGADSVVARWDAQSLAPGRVTVGATTHAHAESSSHPSGAACAGCVHSSSEDLVPVLPTISFVSLMAGTLAVSRLLASPPEDEAHRLVALNLFNLAGEAPLEISAIARNPDCPLACA